ncbi:MAG TPA: glycoside hydrolase family 97 N-terminal domain-containing protein, partial [Bacilli bacterium]
MGRSADLTMLQLKSPKGCLEAEICMSDTGVLSYTVRVEGATAVEPSEMGITVDGVFLGKDVLIGEASYIFIQDSYPARGGHKLAVNEYNEMTVAVNHSSSGVVWTLCARAYDDGFAYRYIVPGNSTRRVNGESSSWTLPEDSEVWFFERNNDWKLKSYAGE